MKNLLNLLFMHCFNVFYHVVFMWKAFITKFTVKRLLSLMNVFNVAFQGLFFWEPFITKFTVKGLLFLMNVFNVSVHVLFLWEAFLFSLPSYFDVWGILANRSRKSFLKNLQLMKLKNYITSVVVKWWTKNLSKEIIELEGLVFRRGVYGFSEVPRVYG